MMPNQYTLPVVDNLQSTMIWPIAYAQGELAVIKVIMPNHWNSLVNLESLVRSALSMLEGLGAVSLDHLVVHASYPDQVRVHLVDMIRNDLALPALIWHRGDASSIIEHLALDASVFTQMFPDTPPLADCQPVAPALTQRYSLRCDEQCAVHMDWPIQSAQGPVAFVKVVEHEDRLYSNLASESAVKAGMILSKHFGFTAVSLISCSIKPDNTELWSVMILNWSEDKHGGRSFQSVWNYLSPTKIFELLSVPDAMFNQDLTMAPLPARLPKAHKISTPSQVIRDAVDKGADVFLNCLERLQGVLIQGRSTGFQIGVSTETERLLVERHGERATKLLANCEVLSSDSRIFHDELAYMAAKDYGYGYIKSKPNVTEKDLEEAIFTYMMSLDGYRNNKDNLQNKCKLASQRVFSNREFA
jgi:hypothetical protein